MSPEEVAVVLEAIEGLPRGTEFLEQTERAMARLRSERDRAVSLQQAERERVLATRSRVEKDENGRTFSAGVGGRSSNLQYAWADWPDDESLYASFVDREWATGKGNEFDPVRVVGKTPSGDEVRLYLTYEDEGWNMDAFGLLEARIERAVELSE